MTEPLYSIVTPVFNSEQSLEELCTRIVSVFEIRGEAIEILLINDGSKDNSWEVIKRLKDKFSGLVIGIDLKENVGQHKALLCGIRQSRGQFIVTIDDDLQYHPEDIEDLISEQKKTDADIIYGVYREKKHSLLRRAGSRVVFEVFRRFANIPQKASSFKMISRHVADHIVEYNHPYLFLDEILGWYSRYTAYVFIRHEDRKLGSSGYSLPKLIRYSIQIIISYTTLPLRLITWFGFLAFFICLGFILYFIYMKYTYGAELGFTALIVSTIMSTGLILFCIGIIGEYISRLFILQTRRPLFIIKEVIR